MELRVAAIWRSFRETKKTTSIRTQVMPAVVGSNKMNFFHYSPFSPSVRQSIDPTVCQFASIGTAARLRSGSRITTGTTSSFRPWITRSDAAAALVSEVADGGSTDASSEAHEEEGSVRFDDFAASDDCACAVVIVVLVHVSAHPGALNLLATAVQDAETRNVRLRVATVGAGDLDGVGLVELLAAVQF